MTKTIAVKTPEVTFQDWLQEWSDEVVQTQEFTKTELPTSPEAIQPDLSRTTREYPRMAELLAEVEGLLVTARAVHTLDVKSDPKFADLTGPERKTIVESRLVLMARTRDILKATVRALHERSFALMSQKAYCREELRLTAHSESR